MEKTPPQTNTPETQPGISPEQMLREINEAVPNVEWQTYIPEKQFGVVIKLPFECSITGTLTIEKEKRNLYLDIFYVNEKLRGHGIGPRLIKLLIDEGRKYGASTLSGRFTSEAALKSLSKVAGEKNLRFSSLSTGEILSTPYNSENQVDLNVAVDLKDIPASEETSG